MGADRPAQDDAAQPLGMSELEQDEAEAAGILERLTRRANGLRSWVHRRPGGARIWRVAIALVGLIVIVGGVVLLVLPGPGWLIIFLGLGIWATEFAWAKSLLTSVQRAVANAAAWMGRQPRWLMILLGVAGVAVLAAAAVGTWMLTT
jgi:uncharacterized protein (TIGR02611 family)